MEAAPSLQTSLPTRRRRQKHSCDQCRRGKRACDAGLTPSDDAALQGDGSSVPQNSSTECAAQPCTNCRRGRKSCTFEWLKALSENTRDGKRKRSVNPPPRIGAQNDSSLVQHTNRDIDSQDSVELLDSLTPMSSSTQNATKLQPRFKDQPGDFADHGPQYGFQPRPFNDLDSLETLQDYPEQDDPTNSPIITNNEYGSQPSESNILSPRELSASPNVRRRRRPRAQHWDRQKSELTLFSGLDIANTTYRHFVKSGLLRVYHDSMENALSCWLTEHNCPYTSVTRRRNPIIALESAHVTMSEWGSIWPNRIYSRVCHLDMAYSSVRSRPLTRNEERTASQALNLAVLSFAAQWAQAGDRATSEAENIRQNPGTRIYPDDTFPQSDAFGRSMQETLWNQASRVLHEAAGIESFRVVFALIIFSMTQRPLDIAQPAPLRPVFEDLQQITEADGPPLLFELGLRQAFSYRRKLENFERQRTVGSNSEDVSPKQSPLQQEDHETINLLFWFGVMVDTLSSAMWHRPLVVEDADTNAPTKSVVDSPQTPPQSSSSKVQPGEWGFSAFEKLEPPNELWGDRFLSVKPGTVEPTRWPCSYKLAASTLSDAAPVKVLLFRRVARLETLLSRKADAAGLESAINDAFHVYDYWNRTYGPFMLDCIAYHDELPARIQSWYIILAGHWHLASFLLADLIKAIDSTNMSLPTERRARQLSQLVAKLRQENARAVSDLSRSSLHGSQGRSFSKSGEFHFAVNKAALLTEPWTVVLIRSFSRAGYILAEAATTEPQSTFVHQVKQRCEGCIEALWFLGKKSDMAFLAARLLNNMLNEPKTNATSSITTDDTQHSVGSKKTHLDRISLQSSHSTLDGRSYFDTGVSELPVGQGFGLDSLGSDSIPDLQSYSMLEDTSIDEEGCNGSSWGSQYHAAPSFQGVNQPHFVDQQ